MYKKTERKMKKGVKRVNLKKPKRAIKQQKADSDYYDQYVHVFLKY